MKRLLSLAFLLIPLGLFAATSERVELFIEVTNAPATSNTLTINGVTRTWTNVQSSTTIATNYTAAIAKNSSATNLHQNLAVYLLADRPIVLLATTNKVRLVFQIGTAVTASSVGDWASITYVTNIFQSPTYTVRVPITVEAATNRTNIASWLVQALAYSTSRLTGGWESTTNLPFLAGNNTFAGTNSFSKGGWDQASLTNVTVLSGVVSAITNGYATNLTLGSPKFTNGVNYGLAFSSPGTATFSEQFGNTATASGQAATAVGYGSVAALNADTAVGREAEAGGGSSVAVGHGSEALQTNAIAVGKSSSVNAIDGIAVGRSATVATDHTNSIVVGAGVTSTETNQFTVGSASHKVRIPGRLEAYGTVTNAIMTGTNKIGASGGPYGVLSVARYNNTGLANGNNAAVDLGGSSYVKVSGPSASFNLNGVAGGFDGRLVTVQNSTGFNMVIANDSGVDPTAGNRIYTGTGADVTVTNNPGFVTLIYDSTSSRWGVVTKSN